jgi:O-acetylserine/cysteine efflux transporter
MHAGMTAGMASLLTQVQVFFSMIFAAIILREVPNTLQLVGAVVAFAGIGLIARHLDSTITLTGFILIIAAAASWGMGNLVTKKIGHVNMLSLVVWGSFFASFPLTLFTLLIDGPQHMLADFHRLTWVGMSAILYIVYGSTWVGYGVWNWLVSRHSVPVIVPFTLLVPVVGMLSSVLFYHEPFQTWKLLTGIFIITGLCINILGARLSIKRSEKALASS